MLPMLGYRALGDGFYQGAPAVLTPAKGAVWVQVRWGVEQRGGRTNGSRVRGVSAISCILRTQGGRTIVTQGVGAGNAAAATAAQLTHQQQRGVSKAAAPRQQRQLQERTQHRRTGGRATCCGRWRRRRRGPAPGPPLLHTCQAQSRRSTPRSSARHIAAVGWDACVCKRRSPSGSNQPAAAHGSGRRHSGGGGVASRLRSRKQAARLAFRITTRPHMRASPTHATNLQVRAQPVPKEPSQVAHVGLVSLGIRGGGGGGGGGGGQQGWKRRMVGLAAPGFTPALPAVPSAAARCLALLAGRPPGLRCQGSPGGAHLSMERRPHGCRGRRCVRAQRRLSVHARGEYNAAQRNATCELQVNFRPLHACCPPSGTQLQCAAGSAAHPHSNQACLRVVPRLGAVLPAWQRVAPNVHPPVEAQHLGQEGGGTRRQGRAGQGWAGLGVGGSGKGWRHVLAALHAPGRPPLQAGLAVAVGCAPLPLLLDPMIGHRQTRSMVATT